MWAKSAKLAFSKKDDDPTGFYAGKLKTARFYYERILPETSSLFAMIMAGGDSIMDIEEELFGAAVAA